jgi:hypothetical protein
MWLALVNGTGGGCLLGFVSLLLDVWLVMPVMLEVASVILLNAILLVSEPSWDRASFWLVV